VTVIALSSALVVPAPGTHENRRCKTILAALLRPAIFVGTRIAVPALHRLSLRSAGVGRDDTYALSAHGLVQSPLRMMP